MKPGQRVRPIVSDPRGGETELRPRAAMPGWIAVACIAWAALAGVAQPLSTYAGERPHSPSQSRPVLELRFEGNVADSSGAGHTMTPHHALTFAKGRHGQCVSLDGRSWIDTGLLDKDLGDEFTVECWVNPGQHQRLYADVFGNHVSQGLGFVVEQDASHANQFLAACGAGAGRWILTPSIQLQEDRWQHIALVKSRNELQFYLNGVLVAFEAAAPAGFSPMPIAVGLGYSSEDRCFQGLLDDFRIWNKALTTFDHAEIDAAAADQTRAQYLQAAPRPAPGPIRQSWTLQTADTRLGLGLTAAGELVVRDLTCLATGKNWIASPAILRLWPQVELSGQSRTLQWHFVDAVVDNRDGRKLTLRFLSQDPTLEVASQWQARSGPIHHSLRITNRSNQPVTIGEQPTFDLDLADVATLWSFHSDGGTPDGVGVYHRPISAEPAGRRYSVRTAPSGEFLPYVVLEADDRQGLYMGLEWSCCRIEAVALGSGRALRVRAGNVADLRVELAPNESCEIRPGFIGTYRGDLDDAGNQLRHWLFRYRVPELLRRDPTYPKVQWNAFGATGKAPGSWDPVERKYYPLIDDIAPLGFEEVMIDVGWWEGSEPDSDKADWPSGMRKAADYAHQKGLRFGLYWTDNADMVSPHGRQQRADRVKRLFHDYHADMWRSDNTRGELIGPSFAATRGFYDMVDRLAREIPGFQWENCSSGGRIKDFGAMHRATKIFNSDTYSALHVRQAFHDTSYALHSSQIEGHLGSTDGRYRPRGVSGIRYAFRSMSMGAPEWFLDAPSGDNGSESWTRAEKDALKACVETYKSKLRPLMRTADLYHIFPRPDGRNRDGIEYYDPAAGQGVVYLFQPSAQASIQPVRLKGLDTGKKYRLTFADGTHPAIEKSALELVNQGLAVTLPGDEVSELIFFEVIK